MAALERFERDGFEATTIDDIAAAVDIAPSVFARSLQLQAGWETAIAEAMAVRLRTDPGGDITPLLLAAAALAAMRASLRHWLANGATTSLPALVADCFKQLADGFNAR